MPVFEYKAREPRGSMTSGTLTQPSRDEALNWMRVQGWVPVALEEVAGSAGVAATAEVEQRSFFGRLRMGLSPSVGAKDHALAFRQMATMVDAGIVLGDALAIMEEQIQNKRLARAYTRVNNAVMGGTSLTSAMRNEHKVFTPLMTALVSAGEEGGSLDLSFDRLASFLEMQAGLNKKIASAFLYPSLVILVCISVISLLVLVVIPNFMTVFKNMNIPLPNTTKIIFATSVWLRANIGYLLGFLAVFGSVMFFGSKRKELKPLVDRIKMRMPIFGDISYKAAMARSFRTFATLMQSGVPMLGCLDMSGQVANNILMTSAFNTLRDQAELGRSISATARNQRLFPPMVCHMIAVGEETGRFDQMLSKVADWYELELEEKIKRLTSVLEPALIVVVGGVVGLVAMAIFQPIIGSIQAMM